MGLKDIRNLFKKQNRTLLFLVILLLVGVIISNFNVLISAFVFVPLLVFCFILFVASLIYRYKTTNILTLTRKNILRYIAVTILLIAIFTPLFFFVGETFFSMFFLTLFAIAIFNYILITSIFVIFYCYDYGNSVDAKLYNAPTAISFVIRWIIFLGGTLLSVFMILAVLDLGGGLQLDVEFDTGIPYINTGDINIIAGLIPWVIIYIIAGFAIIALILAFFGKLNAWLGFFFMFAALYTSYLMIRAIIGVEGSIFSSIYYEIALYIFDVLVIFITISTLVGKKAEIISKEIRFITTDSIIIWLIFSKGAYEFADQALTLLQVSVSVSVLKNVAIFFLFVPLLLISGILGIKKYSKLKEGRKRIKKRKKTMKENEKKKKIAAKKRRKAMKKN